MDYKHCCVVDADKIYKTLVLVLLEPDQEGIIHEAIQYYTLADGETLIGAAQPTHKPYAGAAGLVKPRWNGDDWAEAATAEEIKSWDDSHPAPPPPNPDIWSVTDRLYPGTDLAAKFAAEIAAQGGDVWAWIRGRIKAANFAGIHVGDYIPFIAAGNSIKAEVAGIDTYYRYDNMVPRHHIDFISRACWREAHVWNKVNYNNGTSVSPHPWLASDLYAWLNSLAMKVPNSATANPAMVDVDYRTSGVWDKLPAALQAVIVPKRFMAPMRYTAGQLLSRDNSWRWIDIGKLWLPTDVEVYGSFFTATRPWGGTGVQYPIFANNAKRIKGVTTSENNDRVTWWLANAVDNYTTHISIINGVGYGDLYFAGYSQGFFAPVCFRIS